MTSPRMLVPVLLALALALPGALAPLALRAQPACAEGAFPLARLELYFGTQKPGGAPVTAAEWAAFLDEEVTPRFPDGLTVLTGNGQWRNSQGVVTKETSAVLVILYEPSGEKEAAIEDIRAAYKDRFAQESVMRVDAGMQGVSFSVLLRRLPPKIPRAKQRAGPRWGPAQASIPGGHSGGIQGRRYGG
ncbi:MAG: DUF3574 domain-containing protein [Kiloniellaceae bacterium]